MNLKTVQQRQLRRPKLVEPLNFLLATRDTGYRSTALAIAELIDNSLQATATRIEVVVTKGTDSEYPLEILVIDDGLGMDAKVLSEALTFGGSSRFGDRQSLGRFGMGLPNGTLSQSRRVEVYSWQGPTVLRSTLDIDEITSRSRSSLAPIIPVIDIPFARSTESGTVVRMIRCDRLGYKKPNSVAQNLHFELGRIFRVFLESGVRIIVNGSDVVPSDPMFLQASSKLTGARQYGDDLFYRMSTPNGSGQIRVRFAELPIDLWHKMQSEMKRELGITNGASVSILRSGREIDRGWFFMGSKRRENYDDWWRCEVSFDPELDELFGITHSKQSIVPRDHLLEVLVPDLEPIARALNNRARKHFEMVKATAPLGAAEIQASRTEGSLKSIAGLDDDIPEALEEFVRNAEKAAGAVQMPYQIMAADLPGQSAFEVVNRRGRLLLLLNTGHPFYRDLYGPLAMSEVAKDQEVAKQVALAMLAAARAEVSSRQRGQRRHVKSFRQNWADIMATFFNA
jgi:hypothetical protein